MPEWLSDAVFYEIYPPSYQDSDGDGIGDLRGIISRLDYIRDLGFNALWINPFYDSPFRDGGYDVRDHRKVAPRYGTVEDAKDLFRECHARGIKVLLDLVAGHTSDEHPWFRRSSEEQPNEYSDLYIWTDDPFCGVKGHPYIAGAAPRSGCFMVNFFSFQPALNYGWGKVTERWQMEWDDPRCRRAVEEVKKIMRFWLDQGCDGFRCDMADSLVKEDEEFDKIHTSRIWREIRRMLDEEYPEAALASEWSCPRQALKNSGFHMDFLLDNAGSGYRTLLRDEDNPDGDHSYFKKDAGGDIRRFLSEYLEGYRESREYGYISLISGNHDTPRLHRTLTDREISLYYGMMLTMPGVPYMYYGDEIGMRYLPLPSKEGGYSRTGSRTPMQWSHEKNDGFSTAEKDQLYLPLDESEDAPVVRDQLGKEGSLLEIVRGLVKLRRQSRDLQADAPLEILLAEKGQPFLYRRGGWILGVNPDGREKRVCLGSLKGKEVRYQIGSCRIEGDAVVLGSQSFGALS